MKQRNNKNHSSLGFTLIELLVVIAIMGTLVGFMIINLGQQSGARNLRIGENELVTQLRKVQSYSLSSRVLPSGQPVQYYLLKFDFAQPDRYYIQGIYDKENTLNGRLKSVETIHLPQQVTFDPILPATASGLQALPANGCLLIAFKAPFARVIVNEGCAQLSPPADPYTIGSADDYAHVTNFNSSTGVTSDNSIVVLKLKEARTGTTKSVTIQSVNGLVTFE